MRLDSLFSSGDSANAAAALCPGCRHPIPLDDINVAKDLALCRACGKTWTFSQVNAAKALAGVDLGHPPKGVRVTEYQGSTKIVYHRISPTLLFLIPFTALWSGFSMYGIYGSQIRQGKFDLFSSLFGLPFLMGTVVLCMVILFGLFGRWEINLRRGEGNCFVGIGPFGWRRRFKGGPGARASLEMSSFRTNNQPQESILIEDGGTKIISFGATLGKRDVKVFIAAAISRALA